MSASYTDPGARELARRLADLSSGKRTAPSEHHVTVSDSPDERWSKLGQLAFNVAPVLLPVLGRLVPRRRAALEETTGRVRRRRRPFFNRWRLFRLSALALGVVYLRLRFRRRSSRVRVS